MVRRILEDSDESDNDRNDYDNDVMIIDDDIDGARRRADENARVNHNNPQQNNNNHQQQQLYQNAVHPELQQQLKNEAGVTPSNYWLEQCLSHLRGVGNSGILPGAPNEDESLFTQILHADLRDVVRDPFGNSINNNSNSSAGDDETTAAVQLRNAIIQSNRNADNFANNSNSNNNGKHVSSKVTLPSNFHLMIQMEEVIDVSLNAEQQLAAMGGGGTTIVSANNSNGRGQQTNNNMPNRNNPKNRCLKMVFSDGYHANGKPYPSNDNRNQMSDTQILYAVETSQIQNLSMQSPPGIKPGIKLVLHGPVDVRLGILQLNDGNCKVIGGEIERWKDIQIRARERAQKQRGLGVDPTIKALIGVGNELEEDVDEGEGESGDVAAPAPPPPPPRPSVQEPVITPPNQYTGQQQQQQYQQQHQQQQHQPSSNMNYAAASSQQNTYSTSNATTSSSLTANASSRSSGGNGGGNKRQQTMDAYPKKPRPETHRLLPKNTNRPAAQQQNAGSNNPYQHPSNDSIGQRNIAAQSNNNNNNLAPMFQQQPRRQQQQPQQQQPPPPPPPIQSNSNVIPIDDSPPTSSSHKSSIPPQQRTQSNPYSSLRPAAAAASATTSSSSGAPTTFTSNPSFSELKSLLQSLRSNRALYEQYHGKIITVPCKIDKEANDKIFNIAKADKSDSPKKKGKSSKKKEKKYEFLMVSNFLGPKTSDGKVACRIESSVVEPYFDGHSPAEIRKLSREDKERANRIVNQSSSTFVHDFSSLCQLQMKLMLTADEFFAKLAQVPASSCEWMHDTGNPFLLVVKKL